MSSRRRRATCRSSSSATGRSASLFPDAVGFVPPHELGPYYERASVVVVPSRREGYGMVAREAMAYGRPVVATAVGGLVDAVEDGVTGLLVPAGDSGALREALITLLGNAELRGRLGGAAAMRIADGFSRAVQVAALVAAYDDARGLPRGRPPGAPSV